MDDYKFLEEVGRFVADKGKLLHEPTTSLGANNKGKGRQQKDPEWVVKAREAGMEIILLKEGMERRKLNMSRFTKRSVCRLLVWESD